MTIYLVKYLNTESGQANTEAFSSNAAADKRVRQLTKEENVELVVSDEYGSVRVAKPKTQAEVIELINSL